MKEKSIIITRVNAVELFKYVRLASLLKMLLLLGFEDELLNFFLLI